MELQPTFPSGDAAFYGGAKPAQERTVDLIGLSGLIADVEIRENWAAVKIDTGNDWFANLMIEFDCNVPDWLVVGAKVKITRQGLLLLKIANRPKGIKLLSNAQ